MLRRICAEALQVEGPIKVTAKGMLLENEYIKYDKEGYELSRIQKPKHEIALLQACKDIRSIAVPVFYHVNLFEITLSHFDAATVQSWWNRAQGVRAVIGKERLEIAWADDEVKNIKDRLGDFDVLAPGLREWLATESSCGDMLLNFTMKRRTDFDTKPIPQRAITFNLTDSEPSWDNLEEWLRLWHGGQLPGFCGPFIEGVTMTPMLQAVANVFESVGGLRDETWGTVKKLLPGLRKFLEGVDKRWAEAVVVEEGTEEEGQMANTAPPGCAGPEVEGGLAEGDEEDGSQSAGTPAPTGRVVDLDDDDNEDFDFDDPSPSTQYYDTKQAQTQQEPREASRYTPMHRPAFRRTLEPRPSGVAAGSHTLTSALATSTSDTSTATRPSGLPPPPRKRITKLFHTGDDSE